MSDLRSKLMPQGPKSFEFVADKVLVAALLAGALLSGSVLAQTPPPPFREQQNTAPVTSPPDYQDRFNNIKSTDCSGSITTGGTAQNAHAALSNLHGMTIANIDTTEVLWISFTGTAVAGAVGSYPLAPATATTFAGLSSYSTPIGFGYNTALSVIAATTGHKWSCTRW